MALSFDEIFEQLRKRELIEVSILAREISKSEETVRRWIKEGKVEGIKIGGRWFVKKKSLERVIEDNSPVISR